MKRNTRRVAVLYSAPEVQPAGEPKGVGLARAVAGMLKASGYKAWAMAVRKPVTRLVGSLTRRRPDVVLNLVRSYGGSVSGGAAVAGLLELLGVPHVGSPSEVQGLCLDRERVRALLRGAGLPVFSPGPGEAEPPGQLVRVTVLALPEPVPLPMLTAEEVSGKLVPAPSMIDPDQADAPGRLAVAAFRALGCRDVALVDVRLDDREGPAIAGVGAQLELETLTAALEAAGRDVPDTFAALTRQALERGSDRVG